MELLESRALLAAITEFSVATANALPAGTASGIVAVPGGSVWFTEPGADKIGQVTTAGVTTDYSIPTAASNPQGIAFGPDGNLWFTEAGANKIGVINTSGIVIAQYTIPTAASNPQGITAGPDGNLWFTQAATGTIGVITTAGVFLHEYPITTVGGQPAGITAGPDGNLWFTEPGANLIGKISPTTGAVTEYSIMTAGGHPQEITTGPDGNLWFTEAGAAKVGEISPATGAVTEFAVPTPGGVTEGITAGSDGNLWFTEPGTAQVGRVTTSGVVTEFATPTSSSQPYGIAAGPDGNIWFTEAGANKMAQVALAKLISVTGNAVMTQVGNSFSPGIATFTSAAVNAQPADFTAMINWGDGSTSAGTITASAGGGFIVSATKTYSTVGVYQAQVTITDAGGSKATASATVTVANAATGSFINPVEGQLFSGQVASFSDPQTTGQVGQYSATINWGDNTATTPGVITCLGGTGFTVAGSHTYAEEGTYGLTVTVMGPNGRVFLANGQAVVADAPLHAVATTSLAAAGVPFTGVVATFSDDNPLATISDFQAMIVWGDGHTSTGTIVAPTPPNSFFSVTGTNTYATTGSFTAQVTIRDVGGSTATASSTVTVVYPATGNVINPVEGQLFSGQVASFSDPQTTGQVGQYTATINWGDNTTATTGVITFTGGTDFTVAGSHTYAEEGPYPLTVTVTGPNGRTFLANGQAVVADAPLHASAAAIFPNPTTLVPFTGVVATFTDDDPMGTAADYQATIVWGDGHTSTGTIAGPGNNGFFTVTGTNTYATAGSYVFTVTIVDNGGSTVTTSPSTISVGNIPALLTGYLDPGSISGPSKNLNITNVTRPTFEGMAAPFAIVQLFAQQGNTNPTMNLSLGQTIAGPEGFWSLTSPTLSDGAYTISASMISQAGFPTAPVLIVSPNNPLVIDTIAPRVSGMAFNPKTGVITVVISDAWSGVFLPSLLDPNNYVIMPKRSLIGSNSTHQSLNPAISGFYTSAESATVQFEVPLAAGHYLFMVKSGGVIDLAGNALDGEFTGRFPSGNGQPGGNFIVQLNVPHHLAKPHPRATRRIRGR